MIQYFPIGYTLSICGLLSIISGLFFYAYTSSIAWFLDRESDFPISISIVIMGAVLCFISIALTTQTSAITSTYKPGQNYVTVDGHEFLAIENISTNYNITHTVDCLGNICGNDYSIVSFTGQTTNCSLTKAYSINLSTGQETLIQNETLKSIIIQNMKC